MEGSGISSHLDKEEGAVSSLSCLCDFLLKVPFPSIIIVASLGIMVGRCSPHPLSEGNETRGHVLPEVVPAVCGDLQLHSFSSSCSSPHRDCGWDAAAIWGGERAGREYFAEPITKGDVKAKLRDDLASCDGTYDRSILNSRSAWTPPCLKKNYFLMRPAPGMAHEKTAPTALFSQHFTMLPWAMRYPHSTSPTLATRQSPVSELWYIIVKKHDTGWYKSEERCEPLRQRVALLKKEGGTEHCGSYH